MNNRLFYRRQFIIARESIPNLNDWNNYPIGQFKLYVHPDLKITIEKNKRHKIILLGDIFDPSDVGLDNTDIITKFIIKANSFDDIIGFLHSCSGRYILFYETDSRLIAINDALSLREIYYCTSDNLVVCASQPNLIKKYSQPVIEESNDPLIISYMKYHRPSVRQGRLWVGDETAFRDIKHLLPNHYLDISKKESIRYWPNKKLKILPTHDSAKLVSELLQSNIKAISNRYKIMMAITAGNDSRSLLAASREISDKIYFFINNEGHLIKNSPDILIPIKIFKSINLPFHIHEIDNTVDAEFNNIFLENTYMSTNRIISTIYNVYFKKHSDKVNLLGVGEIGREYYGKAPKLITGAYLARCLKYKKCQYANKQCEKWLQATKPIANKYNVDIMSLFLWEVLLGSWGAVGNSESDIAIEEFDPYDSHLIYEIMLSSEKKGKVLFDEMYKIMWPELSKFPINPPVTFKQKIKYLFKKYKIYTIVKKIEYGVEFMFTSNKITSKNEALTPID